MSIYFSALILGIGFSSLAMGIFISMRIFNIPDITTDGSFTLGGAVSAVLLSSGLYPWTLLPVVFLCGAMAGVLTGIIHARFKVNALLAGILVMTALYSVNLAIMGRSTIPLIKTSSVFSVLTVTIDSGWNQLVILLFFTGLIAYLLTRLLATDFGLAMRATGNNEQMIRAYGVNTVSMKITGLAMANGLTAISGFLIVQVQGFADINMGIGIVILGLGAVMIGERIFSGLRLYGIAWQILGVIAGSILFRFILAFALSAGIDPVYLKLVVSLFVLAVIILPPLKLSR